MSAEEKSSKNQPAVSATARSQRPRKLRRILVQAFRIGLFALVVFLIHRQHAIRRAEAAASKQRLQKSSVEEFFPDALECTPMGDAWTVRLAGDVTFRVVQTSPQGDGIIGFSGPTNVLIAVDDQQRISRVAILSSDDTREHVQHVVDDATFLDALVGVSQNEIATADIDAVSGATLTSMAVKEAIVLRLTGLKPGSRFDELADSEMTFSAIQKLFPKATDFSQQPGSHIAWDIQSNGKTIGEIVRTSPVADNIVGYQGPTDCLVGLNGRDEVVGMLMRGSFDNEPYTDYVRDDEWFLGSLNANSLTDLASGDAMSFQVEGVSGATMTSLAVADGVFAAAKARLKERTLRQQRRQEMQSDAPNWWSHISLRDFGTMAVVAFALIFGFTRLRGRKSVRIVFQCVLIGYLGLMNGDMLSQALLVGWAQNGIPWRSASGLVLLTAVAFLVPMTTKTNLYCSHLCPHGALQQLVRNRLPWQVQVHRRIRTVLWCIPWLLLLWVVVVAMTGLAFSLVDIEPFDAWLPTIAGWATVTIAVVGLVASLFIPLAYCQYGCPTGALLNFFRLHRRSDRLSKTDYAAVGCLLLALVLMA